MSVYYCGGIERMAELHFHFHLVALRSKVRAAKTSVVPNKRA